LGGFNIQKAGKYVAPPKNETELKERLSEIRKHYEPFLQSLPQPLEERSYIMLDSDEWLSQYEVKEGDYENIEMPVPKPWHLESYNDSAWEVTTVPEWRYRNIDLHTTVSCILWYRYKFDATLPEPGERVFLNFTGVDWEAEVWLNGEQLGYNLSYYQPFRFEVTDVLKKQNILAVRVKTGQLYGMSRSNWGVLPTPPATLQRVYKEESRSYIGYEKNDLMSGAGYGIYRSLYLETTGEATVNEILVRGYPEQNICVVKTDIDVKEDKNLTLKIQIIPENFKGRTYNLEEFAILHKGSNKITTNITVPKARLWTTDTPFLYRCRAWIMEGENILDAKDVLFGYRSFEMVSELNPRKNEPAGRFILNGKPIYLRGTNVQGFNLLAHWNKKEELLDLLYKLKAANFNAIRSCQHVQYREVRELMDRVGIMSQQDQGGRHPYERIEEMRNMPEEKWKIIEGRILNQMLQTSAILAKECYNNPGVVLISNSNEAGKDRGPWEINPVGVIEAAISVDPERIIKPICGHHAGAVAYPVMGTTGYDISPELWKNVIDDVHTYQGWYIWQDRPDLWTLVYPEDKRMITVGEYGGEAIDSYETMLYNYPASWGPAPAKEEDTIIGNIQTQAKDIKQFIGFRGKIPKNLEEYIQASQTVQADMLIEVTKGFRVSNRVSGYFQFHYYDALAAYWPKSIISHDNNPKMGYYAMAQVNQPLVPLPRITNRGKSMELWVVNNYNKEYGNARLTWVIHQNKATILQGELNIDIKAGQAQNTGIINLSDLLPENPVIEIYLEIIDSRGNIMSTFGQEIFIKAYSPEFQNIIPETLKRID
ncbi:MAG: hypothetical protein IH594_08365, partial [Bacteroidales bacterium]|nr:hypothetical protein [Bacteroidales bacterium]